MKRSISLVTALALGSATAIACSPGIATAASPSGAVAARSGPAGAAASGAASESVIVLLRQQYSFPATAAGAGRAAAAAHTAQAPVMTSLRRSHATGITSLPLIDAVVATVSAAEAGSLAASPSVAEVAPNAAFAGPAPVTATAGSSARLAPGVCPAKGGVQLNPEGVELVHAVSGSRSVPTARKLGFTGSGVRVGDIATGMDPAEREMIRPDGRHVIAVYKDFTGEGTKPAGPEDLEAFLDDSLMAAQGRSVYDLHDYNPSLPKGCDIRLQGVAPGITLDAYKVYGNDDMTTTSALLEAINYAVEVNHVNVLNEEGGSFPMPDTSQDLIKAANAAAMAAGVTITSPSYDAGPESTIWSPSSQPGVISVGASTGFRAYAQDDIGGYSAMGARGWVSDNISSLSSGGSTEGGRSIDVVAPGDLDWIACAKSAAACGSALTIEGGTSESGPIVAAVAALVIQAYRSTHHGATPSAGLVRDIISSSADDLAMPASEQGSGLVDAYRAVRAAMTANHGRRSKAATGPALVASTQQLAAIGAPRGRARFSFELTNDGTKTASVELAGRTLGSATTVFEQTVHLTSKGLRIFHFTLRRGAAVLTADVAAPGVPVISLVNPQGKLTAYSLSQGLGSHGQVEVRDPSAGRWEAEVSGTGKTVRVQVTTARMRGWGSVSPRRLRLAPGASRRVTLAAQFPAAPGDQSAAVTVRAAGWGSSSLPVTLRSLVPIVHGVGHFHATLVGGNGRGYVPAQTFFYNFDVPAGQPALDVQASLAGQNTDPYYAYLIDPKGEAVAQASNQVVTQSGTTQTITGEPGARLHTLSPPAGRWTIIITFTNPVNGNALATPLAGTISFAPITATVTGLPDSMATDLAAGSPQTVDVTVHNNGAATEAYFLDGRLDSSTSMPLTSTTPSASLQLPLPDTAELPQWIVPTDTTSVTATAMSTSPTTFDMGPYNGEPDLAAALDGDDASATLTAAAGTSLTQGNWAVTPQQIGPFGSAAAASSTTTLSLVATTPAFDPALTSATGDLWEQGATALAAFNPVLVKPGQTVTLVATITPAGSPGQVISGVLYLDDYSALSNNGPSPSGDQLAALPYTYTIG
jgi:hypothetical protein